MGRKSTKYKNNIAAQMKQIRQDYPDCEQKRDYFLTQLTDFLNRPPGGQRQTQYNHMKAFADNNFLPVANNLIQLITQVSGDNSIFEAWLNIKARAHRDDWTPLKKKSLPNHQQFVKDTEAELNRLKTICNPIPQYVKASLAHC